MIYARRAGTELVSVGLRSPAFRMERGVNWVASTRENVPIAFVILSSHEVGKSIVMKYVGVLQMLFVLAVSPGCSQHRALPGAQTVPATLAVSAAPSKESLPARLARQSAATYRAATRLSFRVDVTQGDPPERVWCTVWHGRQQALELKVYDKRGLIYELSKQPSGNMVKIREKNYIGEQAEEYTVGKQDLEAPTRTWDIHCNRGLNTCIFGSSTMSWLGSNSKHSAFLESVIPFSKSLGIHEVDGFPCDVVQNHRVKDLTETFYIDRDTHVLRRWTHVIRGVTRDRVFSQIEIEMPELKSNG